MSFLGLSCLSSLLEMLLDQYPTVRSFVTLSVTNLHFSVSITITLFIISMNSPACLSLQQLHVEICRHSLAVLPPAALSPPDICRSGTTPDPSSQTLAEKQREKHTSALVSASQSRCNSCLVIVSTILLCITEALIAINIL